MRKTTIDYGTYAVSLVPLRTDAEWEEADTYTVYDFMREFYDAAERYRLPRQPTSSESAGIAVRIISQGTRTEVQSWVRHFFLIHGDPLLDKPQLSAVKLFASKLPEIKSELANARHTPH